MADELPCALGNVFHDALKQLAVEMPRHHNPQGAIRGTHARLLDGFSERRGKSPQKTYLEIPLPQWFASVRKIGRE